MTKKTGFTLIELMIVVAIVAILAAIAVPSYRQFIIEGQRAECQAFALDIASRQERFFTQNAAYSTGSSAPTDLGLPNGTLSENGLCSFAVFSLGNNGFVVNVTAEPAGRDPECEVLNLTHAGLKSATSSTGSLSGDAASLCWR